MTTDERYPLEIEDEDRLWWVRGRIHHVWIEARPAYCDRGHYIAHVEPAPDSGFAYDIDDSDKWPRYYMDFDRMIAEIRDWLDWRESTGPREAASVVFAGIP